MKDEALHILKTPYLLVNLALLPVHHGHETLRGTVFHILLDFSQRHPQLLQGTNDLEHVHLPYKIIPVSVLLL